MKIIFLDIDGVLNHEEYYAKRLDGLGGGIDLPYPLSEFAPNSIENLNELYKKTGAKVVLSTSWRSDGVKKIWNILKQVGFVGEIIDITPFAHHVINETDIELHTEVDRGHEIQLWLKKHPNIIKYVILDDDNDILDSQRDNFIHVDRFVGLTKDDVKRAINILNKK